MKPLRTPRHLLALFLLLTLLPAAALVWAGWRLIAYDRDLEQRSIQKRRDEAVGLIATALHQALVATTQRLADPVAWNDIATDDAFIIAIDSQRIQTIPQTPLLYYPVQPQLPEAVARANADLQQAMQLRQSGKLMEALDIYADLAKLEGVQLAGNPADLVARVARCDLLAKLNWKNDLHREAEQLDADLHASRWQLDRGNYENYTDEVNAWLGHAPAPDFARESLAKSVDDLWRRWQDSHDSGSSSGSESVRLGTQSATLVWTGATDRLTVLVAGTLYLQRKWLPGVAPLLKNSGLRLALQDSNGALYGDPSHAEFSTNRTSTETGLPWAIQVASLNPEEDHTQFEKRRRLYLAGLALLLAVIAAGSYFVGRSVTRELAVARLQSDFVAAVSHEFRTPLTSLRQVTELLSDGRQSDPSRLSSYYQTQTRAADRLQRLVESLLDFGKMEAGAKLYRMQTIDICEWLHTTIQEMQSDAALGQYHIELQCESDGVGRVNADPDALARALRNLIDNAVKYSPDCRTVWVSLKRQDNRLAIRVRDRGIGIPANERKQIFRKFVRGAAAKTNGIKGTGVGLAMVQQIVEAHGGDIQLESQPGSGSTFTIMLPESRS